MSRKKPGQAIRREAEQAPSRRWLALLGNGLAAVVLVLALTGVYQLLDWLRDPHAWPVREVQIEGEFRHLRHEQIAEATRDMLRHGFFGVEVGTVQQRLAKLPWVAEAAVRRVWPDGMQLRIQEQVPVARWGEDGLLNARGELFQPENVAEFAALPRLAGPISLRERVIRRYIEFRQALQQIGRHPAAIELDARRAWRVELDNGMQIRLGRQEEARRMALFIDIYPRVFAAAPQPARGVDMRYSNGFAVHWKTAGTPRRHEG
ncbi:cell division protein FtsQ/DivIB [Thiohalobacter thiocyanaticus]|uniref:Cell division protein FtsQ n=1 Tax=Thiohalobacter thiocyanaticus TaxID=585455 RepID=A0A426QL63_9GAMM|nr:cell division protein FtsQ/DivIB [Thiohalobacter thiocyanaticus]RRQ22513.1 FtsQ-type POTRA domain-containing protein [Thiohalobacter thiocyanaticus]